MIARVAVLMSIILGPAIAHAQALPNSIFVKPTAIEIRNHRQPHSVQVLGNSADGYSLDMRSQAKFTSADPKVALIDADGWVRPVANGQTQITINVAGVSKTVPVKVQLPSVEPPISFRHEVMPVLSRGACNSGGCHG